jgi:cytochrome c biogenesis protein CcdA
MAALSELVLAVAAGGLTTLSPCVFPMLPLVVGGAVQAHRAAPLAMGAGMVSSFAALGVLMGTLGSAIGLNGDLLRTTGAVLLIALGLAMWLPGFHTRFARWVAPLATAANSASQRVDAHSLSGAFLLGGLLGMVWSPCSSPLLASALTLVASEGGALRGALILGLFGLGAALPLVAVAYASRAGFQRLRDRLLARIDALRHGFAGFLVLVGVAILMGWDKRLEAAVLNGLPDAWIDLSTRF